MSDSSYCDNVKVPDPLPESSTFQVTREGGEVVVSPKSHGTQRPIGNYKQFYVKIADSGLKFRRKPITFQDVDPQKATIVSCPQDDTLAVIVDQPLKSGKYSFDFTVRVKDRSNGERLVVAVDPKIVNQPGMGPEE